MSVQANNAEPIATIVDCFGAAAVVGAADALMLADRFDMAHLMLETAKDAEARAWTKLAVVAAQLGRHEEALDRAGIAVRHGDEGATVVKGNALESLGDLTGAAEAYRRGISLGVPEASVNLALMLHAQGEDKVAEMMLRKAMEAGDWLAGKNLGVLLLDMSRLAEAKAVLAEAAMKEYSAWFDLGNCCVALQEIDAARSAYERGAMTGDDRCHVALADLLSDHVGDLAGAEQQYLAATRAGDELGFYNYGMFLREQGRELESREQLIASALLGYGPAWHVLADTALSKGRRDHALSMLRLAVASGDDDAAEVVSRLDLSR